MKAWQSQTEYQSRHLHKSIERVLAHRFKDNGTGNLYKLMESLPFWCGNLQLYVDKPDTYQDEMCCTMHVAGLPQHPATNQVMPLTAYQLEFVDRVMDEVTPEKGADLIEFLRKPHMFHVLKGRQMGFTEIVLRMIFHFSWNRYAGKNVGIMAATTGKLANKDLRRLYKLYGKVAWAVPDGVKSGVLRMTNGTTIEAFPASEEAMTGDTKYACVFMDESAKWKMVDDQPVFNSIMPIVRSNGADLFLVSTPKGPLKTFYKIWKDPQDFVMLKYDIWCTAGNMYVSPMIEYMLKTSKEDPNQEYLCKFTIGRDSIFGLIGDEDRGSDWAEWDIVDDDEDDGYVENDEDEWNTNSDG